MSHRGAQIFLVSQTTRPSSIAPPHSLCSDLTMGGVYFLPVGNEVWLLIVCNGIGHWVADVTGLGVSWQRGADSHGG